MRAKIDQDKLARQGERDPARLPVIGRRGLQQRLRHGAAGGFERDLSAPEYQAVAGQHDGHAIHHGERGNRQLSAIAQRSGLLDAAASVPDCQHHAIARTVPPYGSLMVDGHLAATAQSHARRAAHARDIADTFHGTGVHIAAATVEQRHGAAANQHGTVPFRNGMLGDVQCRGVNGRDTRSPGKQCMIAGLHDVETPAFRHDRRGGLLDIRVEPHRLALCRRRDPHGSVIAMHLMPDHGSHHDHAGDEGQQHERQKHGNKPFRGRRQGTSIACATLRATRIKRNRRHNDPFCMRVYDMARRRHRSNNKAEQGASRRARHKRQGHAVRQGPPK